MEVTTMITQCDCGSGIERQKQVDGYGIFLCYTCPKCEKHKLKGFRADIFERYAAEEPIDEDY
jgi:hypothetical protein